MALYYCSIVINTVGISNNNYLYVYIGFILKNVYYELFGQFLFKKFPKKTLKLVCQYIFVQKHNWISERENLLTENKQR